MACRLILASSSPRRQELLRQMGLEFEVFTPEVDENLKLAPEPLVLALSERKALAVAQRHPEAAVLAADTIVSIGSSVLGKPRDTRDAERMLTLLNSAWHEVHTGVCLYFGGVFTSKHALTRVKFASMSHEEIKAYCDSGEPMGKAGAYAIQGLGGMYVEEIAGSYTNVVGLPTALVRRMLKERQLL